MPTPRELAAAVTAATGADERHTEALTRTLAYAAAGGYRSLTQADFDTVQDAYDDATGRPRRKHANPALWKIAHWWRWHVTSPLDAAADAFWWHAARKHGYRACTLAVAVEHRAYAVEHLCWLRARIRIAQARRREPAAVLTVYTRGMYVLELPDEAAGNDYRARHRITDPVED